MSAINRVQLTGSLSNVPEIKNFENGNKVAHFSLNTREEYVNRKGGKSTDVQWHFITAWGQLAELAQNELDKGSEVCIDGRLVTRNYVDKNGNKRYVTEVVASQLLVGGQKPH